MQKVRIDLVSYVVCPWCAIPEVLGEKAIEMGLDGDTAGAIARSDQCRMKFERQSNTSMREE